jgi:hypothetical protein
MLPFLCRSKGQMHVQTAVRDGRGGSAESLTRITDR